MAYLEENLMAGERVVYRTSLHKIVFFWPALILLVSLLTGMAVFLIGVAMAAYACLRYTSSEFGVTKHSVISNCALD